jgi:hypothetical protein
MYLELLAKGENDLDKKREGADLYYVLKWGALLPNVAVHEDCYVLQARG